MGDFLTVSQFAKKMKLCQTAVYKAIEEDRVQHTKILGRIGIPKTELERFKRRKNGDKAKVLRAF